MARRFEKRVYRTAKGKEIEYTVYYVEDRPTPAIEQAEALRLAEEAGVHSITVSKPIQCFKDYMYYMPEDMSVDEHFKKEHAVGMRYIAYASCVGPDGNVYEDIGSAAPDNVQSLRCYLPEMAIKRARVRAVLLALWLKDLNADIEFVDQDISHKREDEQEDIQKINKLLLVRQELARLGLEKATKKAKEAKKILIMKCLGEVKSPSEFSDEDYDKLLAFLKEITPETLPQVLEVENG